MMNGDKWQPREDGSIPALDDMTAHEAMWALVNANADLYSDEEIFAIDGDETEANDE